MQIRVNYSIIFVSDMERSISFYRDLIGIPLKFQSPGWAEFNTDGATLALHLTNEKKPDDANSFKQTPGACRTGFQVLDIDDFHGRMMQNNIECKQQPTEAFGVKIAQYADPDGLVFSVSGATNQ
jgi:lactoylglutathione lyase